MEDNLIAKMEDSSAKAWDGKYFYLYRVYKNIYKYRRVSMSDDREIVKLYT